MKIKNYVAHLCAVFVLLSFAMPCFILAQEDSIQQNNRRSSNIRDLEDLSRELSDNLKLSSSQQNRINEVLKDFSDELSGSGKISEGSKTGNAPDVESTNKAKVDKTEVKNKSTDNRDVSDVSTGSAKTKNESDVRNVHVAVSFERARIDADSRIEEMLTPEQAIQYGKIKSDWWDKVREKIQPGNLSK